MAIVMTPIYTQTVGSSGASSITFNNIPQIYTDLQFFITARSSDATIDTDIWARFNSDTSNSYSFTRIYGNSAGVYPDRYTSQSYVLVSRTNGTTSTSNIFSQASIYLPNYTSSNFKSLTCDAISENNLGSAGAAYQFFIAGLWRSSNAITNIQFASLGGGSFAQYSTFSLYGIIRSGA